MLRCFLPLLTLFFLVFPLETQAISYRQDPVFIPLNKDAPHPMSELMDMAEENDPRAQFILADLYEKGRGGLPKNLAKSKEWFEQSAVGDYAMGFVRLAAQAKKSGDFQSAYQWYTLALELYEYDAKMRKYVVKARNDIVGDGKLDKEGMKAAGKAASQWRQFKNKQLYLRRKTEREKKEAAQKAAKAAGQDQYQQRREEHYND